MSERAIDSIRRMSRVIGMRGCAAAALYLLVVPPFVVVAWGRSLWASRVLLCGEWHRYRGFHPLNALTSFFYRTQWLNIERFGRWGVSPLLGLGSYPLSRWFHLTLLSSYFYAHAGAVTTLLGALAWVAVHLVWLDAAPAAWTLATVAVLLFSTTAYAMAYTRQNYNILGWLWLPLALYAVQTGHWALAALAWLAASMASITVVFAAVPLMAMSTWQLHGIEPLATLLPALLKLGLHLTPLLKSGDAKATLANMAKMIGLTGSGVRYRRRSMRWRPFTVYFVAIYALSCAMLWWDRGVPVLPLAALALFAMNQVLVRFADEQSVIVMFVSVLAADLLISPPSMPALAALFVAVNPMPLFLGLVSPERDRSLVRTQAFAPFDHTRLQYGMERFFDGVKAGQRVLFAFDDPRGAYESLFDGYRTLIELPLFVAASRGVHLMPDWYAVAETNHEGAADCWGRSLSQVRAHAAANAASHVIVYHDSGDELDPAWSQAGFALIASFDWGDWLHELQGVALWRSAKPPCWRLLAVPD